jgi:drug/metabolite transporter (DMT)-like permease
MESANHWQINFYRSSSLALFVIIVMVIRYRGRLRIVFQLAGWKAGMAGAFVGLAMISNIFALTHTTVANATLLMASGPLVAAVIGHYVLGERTRWGTWLAIIIAMVGITVMVGGNWHTAGWVGDLVALLGVFFFGCYAVSLRLGRTQDMAPAIFYAGVVGALVGLLMTTTMQSGLLIPVRDLLLCVMLGVFQIGIGGLLFVAAAQTVPAVELTLYALAEPMLAPLWTWIGVGEVPTRSTFIGGALLMSALVVHTRSARKKETS